MSGTPWHEPLQPSYSENWGDESTSEDDAADSVDDDQRLTDATDTTELEAFEDEQLEEEDLEDEEYQEELDLEDEEDEEDEEIWNYV